MSQASTLKKQRSGLNVQSQTKRSRKTSVSKSPHTKPDISHILQQLNSPVNIFDHRQLKFIYANDRFIRLTGLSQEECYKIELKDFGSWIHQGDLLILQTEIGKRLDELYNQYVVDDSAQLNYTVNFRLQPEEKNGDPVDVLAQCSVLEWDENHLPALTFNLLTDITHYKHNQKIVLTVKLFDEETKYWKTILKDELLRVPDMLTKREKQITELIILDKSASKISQELNVAYHTVRAHWRNILQKTRCKTQKELKHLAHKEGWV